MSDIANAFAIYQEADGIARDIRTTIAFSQYTTLFPEGTLHDLSLVEHVEGLAIWDTGANGTVITRKIADNLGLQEIAKIPVASASGVYEAGVFVVNFWIPNMIMIPQLYVSEGFLPEGIDALIGMDVITRGDFAITNYSGRTAFTYRYPSCEKTNYTEQTLSAKVRVLKGNGVNSPCPCGSGKSVKRCCLPKYEEKLNAFRQK